MVDRHFNQAAAIPETALDGHLDVGAGADEEMAAYFLAMVQSQSSKGAAAVEAIHQEQAAFAMNELVEIIVPPGDVIVTLGECGHWATRCHV